MGGESFVLLTAVPTAPRVGQGQKRRSVSVYCVREKNSSNVFNRGEVKRLYAADSNLDVKFWKQSKMMQYWDRLG